jgi:hypothetical protein
MSKQVEMLVDSIMEDDLFTIDNDVFKAKLTDRLEQFERETIDAMRFEFIEAVKRVNV